VTSWHQWIDTSLGSPPDIVVSWQNASVLPASASPYVAVACAVVEAISCTPYRRRRLGPARASYAALGGKSPLLELTQTQAAALEADSASSTRISGVNREDAIDAGMHHASSSISVSKRCTMRAVFIVCLAGVCAGPTYAAAPTRTPKPAPVSINISTAGDLADACTVSPTSKASFARLNFCNGFAQGILQTHSQNPSGTKICIPSPSPRRSETMKEFSTWVRADASRKDDLALAWLSSSSWQDGSPAHRAELNLCAKDGPQLPVKRPTKPF
jgi:hypothetical protein